MTQSKKTRTFATIVAVLLLIAGASFAQDMEDGPDVRIMRLEVAENFFWFVGDTEPLLDPADPFSLAYGAEFLTGGYLYPAGTLTCDAAGNCDGVNPDGSAEFPDKVMGTWNCRGWMTGNGVATETGAWTSTTQIYSFTPEIENEYGVRTITTDGYESPEFKDIRRAITGGTGRYAGVRGEQIQQLIGFNPSFGVNLKVKFRLFW